eukprot:9771887-Alexandrium_andersonii.AAC.1
MGFLRSGVVVQCDRVQHRRYYVFAAESRMGWMPENVVVRSSAPGGLRVQRALRERVSHPQWCTRYSVSGAREVWQAAVHA